MALLQILTVPDPRLKIVAEPVEQITPEIQKIMDDMLETMYANDGGGLAATQVNIHKRIVVIDWGKESQSDPYFMVNPEIVESSKETSTMPEACLSVPDQHAYITRPSEVKIKYLDYHGNLQELELGERLANCFQHEIDHLDGILYIDHLSALKRRMLVNKAIKAQKVKNRRV